MRAFFLTMLATPVTTANLSSKALMGAVYMVLAGVSFAGINVITQIVTGSPDYGGFGFKPTSDAFWQYFFAFLFSLPFLIRQGLMVRTPRGRVATRAAYAHMGLTVPSANPALFD